MLSKWPSSPARIVNILTKASTLAELYREPYLVYLGCVSIVGIVLFVSGLFLIPQFSSPEIFLLLVALTFATAFATTSIEVTKIAGITYHIGTAIAISAVPTFGPGAAVLLTSVDQLGMRLFKQGDGITWKKSWRQFAFNTGMANISMYVAGNVIVWVSSYGTNAGPVVISTAWILGALAYTQINAGLLFVILKLQHGREIDLVELWASNRWAMSLDIILMLVGGGALAFAISETGWVGVGIFFLPVMLSALAFRLYVSKMNAHMQNLEAIIAERTKELEEVNREKDAFLAVLTHDMKSPLAAIDMYASLLLRKPELAALKPSILENIKRSRTSLHTMVTDILDLSKLEAGNGMEIRLEPFDIIELAEFVVESHQGIAAKKSIGLEFTTDIDTLNPESNPAVDGDKSTLTISADRMQIERVLNNLTTNAIKYTQEQGQVYISLASDGTMVNIEVRDTGYGIPEDALPHIFDRFRRVDKHKKRATGVGLGLAITKAIIDAHGGNIVVESVENEGSTFTISLPIQGEQSG